MDGNFVDFVYRLVKVIFWGVRWILGVLRYLDGVFNVRFN
jgi:hypothetical protein